MALRSSQHHSNKQDAFPLQQVVVLAVCRLAEPIAYTSVMSYTYVMVQHIKGDDNASFFAGLIVSAFAMAEACTAMFWGTLSDRYGRKPIILVGLAGTVLSCLMVGFAKNYWVAFTGRLLGGLLNGNVAVIQTMVAEIVKNPKHEPMAYAMHPLMWNMGSILGSALGGYAAEPARFYPQIFSPDGLFGRFPYLLPNLVCVAVISIAILQAALFLKETRLSSSAVTPDNQSSAPESIDEQTPLQYEWRRRRSTVGSTDNSLFVVQPLASGSLPTPMDPSLDVRRASFGTIRQINIKPEGSFEDASSDAAIEDTIEEWLRSTAHPSPRNPITGEVIAWITAMVLMCYHLLAYTSVLPIYVLDPPQTKHGLDLRGGLGLTIHEVANYLAVNSIWSLFVQIVIFPILMAKAGIWNCIIWSTILCPIVDIMTPFITLLPSPGVALYFMFNIRMFFYIMIYPGQLIMLKNAAPSADSLGKINGLAVSAASFGRTIAPPLVGAFYDALGSAAAWWSCAIFALLSVLQLYFLHRPGESERDIVRRNSVSSLVRRRV